MQVKKQQLEQDMEQQTGSKSRKEYFKAVYCHPATFQAGRSTSWNRDSLEKYQQPQVCRRHHPNGRKRGRTKEPLDESERGE